MLGKIALASPVNSLDNMKLKHKESGCRYARRISPAPFRAGQIMP